MPAPKPIIFIAIEASPFDLARVTSVRIRGSSVTPTVGVPSVIKRIIHGTFGESRSELQS